MNLRLQAEADLAITLEDSASGFGWNVTVRDPSDNQSGLIGQSNDIGFLIDPETGQGSASRQATVVLRLSSLEAAGFGIPVGISDSSSKPWTITFDDINGHPFTFKVSESHPDRQLGVVRCLLETYDP